MFNTSDSEFYLDHIHGKFGTYRAAWLPGSKLELGMVVKINNIGELEKYGDLKKRGIDFQFDESETAADLKLSSGDGITINAKAQGKSAQGFSALTDLDAGFSIKFTSNNSIVFELGGYITKEINNLDEIATPVLQKYKLGDWDKDLLIVTHIIEAKSATIIISRKAGTDVELKASAAASIGELKLTDTSLGLGVAHDSGDTWNIIATSGVTPLYKVMGINKSFFSGASFGGRALVASEPILTEYDPDSDDTDDLDLSAADL